MIKYSHKEGIIMKKKLLIILMLLFLTSCNQNTTKPTTNNSNQKNNNTPEKNIAIEKEETYIDNNPITLGIYMYYNSYTNRELLTEYKTNWQPHTDICSLEIYYTNEPNIPGSNQKKLWNTYFNNYKNINNYRIGYLIEFETQNEETIEKYILSPNDTPDIYKYIQLYLYDDIHQQDDTWYSHITTNEYTNNNILTSIKLTGGDQINEITSNITLTAFTYDEDDFDENNKYRGISKSNITIKRS